MILEHSLNHTISMLLVDMLLELRFMSKCLGFAQTTFVWILSGMQLNVMDEKRFA